MTTSQNIEVCDAKGIPHLYRPQRSCGKVMFSQVSVILFTGGGVYAQHALRQTPPSPGRHPQADTPWENTPPGRHPPRTDTFPGQTPPPRQTSPTRRPLQRKVRKLLECIMKKVRLVDSVRNLCTPQCNLFLHILECWEEDSALRLLTKTGGSRLQTKTHPVDFFSHWTVWEARISCVMCS